MKQEILLSMKKEWSVTNKGFSLIEVILTSSIFALIITALVGAFLYGQESTVLSGQRARAVILAEEGLEATRNIRDESFLNLANGSHGLVISSNEWAFSGSSDTNDIFTREIQVSEVNSNTKQVISKVFWQQNLQRAGLVFLTTYLTNWQDIAAVPATCSAFCQEAGYASGICRANPKQCVRNSEIYESGGDVQCAEGGGSDTCCCAP